MRFRRAFITGLAAILPILVTLFLLYTLFQYIDRVTQPLTDWLLLRVGAKDLPAPFSTLIWMGGVVLYLFVIAVIVYLIGRVVTSYVGGLAFAWLENVVLKFPVVRAIYPYARQVTDYIFSSKATQFRHVVAVEYPRKGIYSLGFLTGEGMDQIQGAGGKKFVNVYLPSSPTLFTGYLILVPEDDVTHLDMTVDQALRLIISGGVLTPKPRKTPSDEAAIPSSGAAPAGQGERRDA